MPANYTPEEIQKAHEILYNEGIKMRYQVAGKEYVDKSLAAASNPFAKAMQDVSSSRLLLLLPLLLFVTLLLTRTYTVRLRILLGINLDVSLFFLLSFILTSFTSSTNSLSLSFPYLFHSAVPASRSKSVHFSTSPCSAIKTAPRNWPHTSKAP